MKTIGFVISHKENEKRHALFRICYKNFQGRVKNEQFVHFKATVLYVFTVVHET